MEIPSITNCLYFVLGVARRKWNARKTGRTRCYGKLLQTLDRAIFSLQHIVRSRFGFFWLLVWRCNWLGNRIDFSILLFLDDKDALMLIFSQRDIDSSCWWKLKLLHLVSVQILCSVVASQHVGAITPKVAYWKWGLLRFAGFFGRLFRFIVRFTSHFEILKNFEIFQF